jgi:hypothetical protein
MQFTAASPQYAFGPAMAPVPMMAEGGLAAAAQAKSSGRGDDTMLVHMAPGEVKGLQALAMAHGGSLTINPSTGLPEAGFLKKILPMVIGAALTPLTGGIINPVTAGLLVGGAYGAATGSLKKGLMAGLSAYGGAGLYAGLANAATAAGAGATTTAGTTVGGTAGSIGGTAGSSGITATTVPVDASLSTLGTPTASATGAGMSSGAGLTTAPATLTSPVGTLATTPSTSGVGMGLGEGLTAAPSSAATVGSPLAAPAVTTPGPVTDFSAFTKGVPALTDQAGRAAFMSAAPMGTLPSVGTTLASALTPEPKEAPAGSPAYEYDYSYDWNKQAGAFNPPASSGAGSAERRYFEPTYALLEKKQITAAGGGLMGLARGGSYDDEAGGDDQAYAEGGYKRPKARSLTGPGLYRFSQDRKDSSMEASVEENFAKGGLGTAGKSLPPRFLEGAGDGMSDSIKASIGGMQEARLADGEFVVPADVVSHLGNGSSKAGAKKLYAMMDKIRKARTGRERQAPEVNAAKYMPA